MLLHMEELLDRTRDLIAGDDLAKEWLSVALDILALFKRKQNDYVSRNIADLGEKGVFVRVYDKAQRLRTLVWEDTESQVLDEPIERTIMASADYGIIWLLLRRGKWPGSEKEDI